MGLVKQILEFYEAVDDWCKVQPDESNGIVLGKAAFVLNTVSDLNSHLEERIEEIKNGVIRDPFYCKSKGTPSITSMTLFGRLRKSWKP